MPLNDLDRKYADGRLVKVPGAETAQAGVILFNKAIDALSNAPEHILRSVYEQLPDSIKEGIHQVGQTAGEIGTGLHKAALEDPYLGGVTKAATDVARYNPDYPVVGGSPMDNPMSSMEMGTGFAATPATLMGFNKRPFTGRDLDRISKAASEMAKLELGEKELLHGTPYGGFTELTGLQGKNRYGRTRGTSGRVYMTDQPEVANRFAENSGIMELSPHKLNYDEDLMRETLQNHINSGQDVFYQISDPGAPNFGDYVRVNSANELSSGDLFQGRIIGTRKGYAPRVIKEKTYGKTLDLTGPTAPKDFPENLKSFFKDPSFTERGTNALSWQAHERSPELIEYMRSHGYGKALVNDAYESGLKSYLVLPEYIGSGKSLSEVQKAVQKARETGQSFAKGGLIDLDRKYAYGGDIDAPPSTDMKSKMMANLAGKSAIAPDVPAGINYKPTLLDKIKAEVKSDTDTSTPYSVGIGSAVYKGLADSIGSIADISNELVGSRWPSLKSENPVMGSKWLRDVTERYGLADTKERPFAEIPSSFIDPYTGVAALATFLPAGSAIKGRLLPKSAEKFADDLLSKGHEMTDIARMTAEKFGYPLFKLPNELGETRWLTELSDVHVNYDPESAFKSPNARIGSIPHYHNAHYVPLNEVFTPSPELKAVFPKIGEGIWHVISELPKNTYAQYDPRIQAIVMNSKYMGADKAAIKSDFLHELQHVLAGKVGMPGGTSDEMQNFYLNKLFDTQYKQRVLDIAQNEGKAFSDAIKKIPASVRKEIRKQIPKAATEVNKAVSDKQLLRPTKFPQVYDAYAWIVAAKEHNDKFPNKHLEAALQPGLDYINKAVDDIGDKNLLIHPFARYLSDTGEGLANLTGARSALSQKQLNMQPAISPDAYSDILATDLANFRDFGSQADALAYPKTYPKKFAKGGQVSLKKLNRKYYGKV